MRHYKPTTGAEKESAEPTEFDPFAAPRPSAPNKRQERVRRRRRYVRMALAFLLPVALCALLVLAFELEVVVAVSIVFGVFHVIMGSAEMLLGERREPDQEGPGFETYARWFGFRDW